ncbi:MAG: ThiF family adenylyltransferase [Candidatus Riflebacteria bacterium]|nr:ThiF family adenylyltransferase [Candidatus Riflebacteria bacterium]
MKHVTISTQLIATILERLTAPPDQALELFGTSAGELVHVAALGPSWRGLPLARLAVAVATPELSSERPTLLLANPQAPEWLDDAGPVRVSTFDLDEYSKPTRGIATAVRVQGKRVLLVGAGSIGSRVGWELSRLGGLHVLAADRDAIEVHTPARWFGPTLPVELLVEEQKAGAWAAGAACSCAPTTTVEGVDLDLMSDSGHAFERLVRDFKPDLMIVSTDTRDSRLLSASLAHQAGIQALFVGLSDGAESGMIQVQTPATPCWLCANRDALLSQAVPMRDRSIQYGLRSAPENETAGVPALSANVAVTAAVASKLAVLLLAGEPWEPYFRDSAGRSGTVLAVSACSETWLFSSFLQTVVFRVEPDPACPICGDGVQSPEQGEQDFEFQRAQAAMASLSRLGE